LYCGLLFVLGLLTSISQLNGYTLVEISTDRINCVSPGFKMNNTAGQDPSWPIWTVDAKWVEANRCNDPYQTSAHKVPVAMFRSLSDLHLVSQSETSNVLKVFYGPCLQNYFYRGAPSLVFILVKQPGQHSFVGKILVNTK